MPATALHHLLRNLLLFALCTGVLSAPVNAGERPWVEMRTTKGIIIIELFPDKSPVTVENFLNYVNSGFYNGTIIHRAVYDWIVQGGGYDREFQPRETADPIRNEANNGLKNIRGTVAMARFDEPDTADSQFFINLDNNDSLDHKSEEDGEWGYCVFGQVIKGLEVADEISQMEKQEIEHIGLSVPVGPVVVEQIRLLQE